LGSGAGDQVEDGVGVVASVSDDGCPHRPGVGYRAGE
jgi:hypothetical protein